MDIPLYVYILLKAMIFYYCVLCNSFLLFYLAALDNLENVEDGDGFPSFTHNPIASTSNVNIDMSSTMPQTPSTSVPESNNVGSSQSHTQSSPESDHSAPLVTQLKNKFKLSVTQSYPTVGTAPRRSSRNVTESAVLVGRYHLYYFVRFYLGKSVLVGLPSSER